MKDTDFVTVGSASNWQKSWRAARPARYVNIFRTYGTAQIQRGGMELEFVGARRESYRRRRATPTVESTLRKT